MLRLFKQYYPVRNAVFVVGEGLFIFLSVIFASWIVLGNKYVDNINVIFLKASLLTIVCQICLYYNDLYDLKITDTFFELAIRLLQALGASAILLAGVYYVFPQCIIGRGIFIVSIAFVVFFIVSWRFGYTQILNIGLFDQKIILLGSGKLATNIAREIKNKKDCGYQIAAVALNQGYLPPGLLKKEARYICEDNYEGLAEIARKLEIHKIVVALEERRGQFPIQELLECRVSGIEVLEGYSFYEMLTGKLIVSQINPGWLIFSEGFQKSRPRRYIKRTIDLTLSTFMLIILSPLLLVVGLLIIVDSTGPIFYSQERVGERRKPYMMHKFRSMCQDAEKYSGPVWAQTDDDRITRVGHFIRKWRIDELPQLFNVLKGDMSFVGPRPEREHFVKELEEVIPYYGERFSVKPGVTGWAQVSYPYGASVEDAVEKLNYDLFYIKNMSILLDLMVIMRTVKTVIFGEGSR
jgi:sugar transferase (PEP-CTERM system associated)